MNKSRNKIVLFVLMLLLVLPNFAQAEESVRFTDVSETYWAKDEIDSLVQLGVVKGFENNTFRPNDKVTREQFASLITLSFYLDIPTDGVQTFRDVAGTRWSYGAIEAAKDFLTGYYPPNGKAFFNPTGKATREDVAVALVKTMGYQPDDLEDPEILDRTFYDADEVSPNLQTYVALAVEKKLISGYQDGTFRPDTAVTRAESAALLYRVLKNSASDSQQSLVLNVDAPETTSTSTFYVTGDVTKGAKVYINNKEAEVVQGQFRVAYVLEEEGVYKYTVSARMPGGKTQTVNRTIKYEKGGPELEVKGVPETTDKQKITVSWTVRDENDDSPIVYVNGEKQSYYNFSTDVELIDGENTIKVVAENRFGKKTEVVKRVLFQTGGPQLTIGELPAVTGKEEVAVSWTVRDKNDSEPKVYVNDKEMPYYQVSTNVKLQEGNNVITVKAVNKLGKSTTLTRNVVFDVSAPQLTVGPLPETTSTDSVTVSWSVKDNNDSNPKVYVNDVEQPYYVTSKSIELKQGANVITVRAVNKNGKSAEVKKTVNFVSDGPVLKVTPIASTTSKSSVTVSWSVSDKNDSYPSVFVNGEEQPYYTASRTVNLKAGANTIVVKAQNKLGQVVEESLSITFEPSAPTLTLGYAPETTASSTITLSWNVSDENDSSPKVYVNDKLVSYYSSTLNVNLIPGENSFKIVASNSYGKTTEKIYKVTYTPPGN